ncbi:MAG: enoyl-CoA hydratase/isomerase family protein [Ruminococcaceae bacterium]|nr:enoyl-CoA hydratase/isomerase family protein [Oscillospiraceae bacterium]
MYNGILYDVKDRIATITFNNPEEGNAMQFEVYQEIIAALAEADGDDNVAAVIVTGAGKNFCAGGNIRRFKRIIEDKTYIEQKSVRETVRLATAFMRCGKPVIGMINGAAAGLGMGLALACDFRIIAPSTKIVAAFINVALPGDTAIVYNLQRMVGMAKTREWMMTGATIDADEMMRLGLATKLVPEEELQSATLEYAQKLARRPLQAIRRQKQLIYETFYREMEPYGDREATYMRECSMTSDFEEATNAFLEKRRPSFTGK